MIDFDRERVGDSFLSQFFEKTSGVFAKTLEESGRAVAHFYWRVGYRYRAFSGNARIRKTLHSNLQLSYRCRRTAMRSRSMQLDTLRRIDRYLGSPLCWILS